MNINYSEDPYTVEVRLPEWQTSDSQKLTNYKLKLSHNGKLGTIMAVSGSKTAVEVKLEDGETATFQKSELVLGSAKRRYKNQG